MTEPYIINIGRSLGSGGRAVGRLLQKMLDIDYYDRELLNLAARESGLTPEVFAKTDEKNRFLHTLGNMVPFFGTAACYYDNGLSGESLFRIQSEAIRRAAAQKSCIFIGRCADYVLRDNPRCVNVFVTADMADRLRAVCEREGCDRQRAAALIERGDRERANYYNFYTASTWGAAETYHLCINSSVLGIEGTAAYIRDFAARKLGLILDAPDAR